MLSVPIVDKSLDVLLDRLKTVFPVQAITPTSSIESIMFHSGEQNVIEFIKRYKDAKNVSLDRPV